MRKIMLIIVISLICTTTKAAPVTEKQVQTAAETFISLRYPASTKSKARTVTSVGNSDLAVREITTLAENNNTVGFVVNLEPTGYVLMRSDDLCPPIKIYSDKGCFSNLPPNFISVIKWELETEIKELNKALKKKNNGISIEFNQQWKSLINSTKQNSILQTFSALSKKSGGPLLSTIWGQGNPYNYYCPDVSSGGSDGRAPAGCGAIAMAQVIRYNEWPNIISDGFSYDDNGGDCTGHHSAKVSTFYYSNMPDNLTSSSPEFLKADTGKLIYNCAVILESNFESGGTATSTGDLPPAFREYFYTDCTDVKWSSNYTDSQWYDTIENDIDSNRPIWYRFDKNLPNTGHAVVCDGCKNGNEISINMGWHGGSAWYNIDDIAGYNYHHAAVFQIRQQTLPSTVSLNINNGAASTSSRTVTLNNTYSGYAAKYKASENSNFSGASWEDYNSSPTFTLSEDNGTKTVYFKLKNDTGESISTSDSIQLGNNIINDNFSDAINLSGNSGNTTGDSTGSTTETGEPAHADKGPYNSVWWKFTPSSNGKLDLNTHGSSFDTVLAMYIGSAVNNLTTKASNDDDGSANNNSGFTDVSLIAGTTYYIAVGGYNSAESGSISLNWNFTPEDLQVATPTISPNGGSHQNSVQVTLACSTSGAQIRYTINGSTPTSSSTLYSSPFTLTSDATVKAKAFKSGYTESDLASADFTITYSTDDGTKYGNWAITDFSYEGSSDWDAKINEIFGSEYRVADWTELKDFYSSSGDLLDLFDGLYLTNYGVSVALENNGDKTYSSTRYYFASRHEHNKPGGYIAHDNIDNYLISLGSWSGSRKILAVKDGSSQQVVTPTISPNGGSHQNSVQVTLVCSTSGAQIRYTKDGTTPTSSSTLYSSPFTLTSDATIKAKAFKSGYTESDLASADFTITYSNDVGTKYGNWAITDFSYEGSSDWDAKINEIFGTEYRVADWTELKDFYSSGGDLLDLFDGLYLTNYGASVALERNGNKISSGEYYYFASRHEHNKPGYYGAHDNIDNYLISLGSWTGSRKILAVKDGSSQQVATPTISPNGGTYQSSVQVTLACSTSGAQIRYTKDGSSPTSSSTLYSSPFTLTSDATIKAKAFKSGYTDSEIASASFTITNPKVATPTISPNGGTFPFQNSVQVTLACSTSGAQIYYTKDGTTPTESSRTENPFRLTSSATVKTKAFKSGYTESDLASADFIINNDEHANDNFSDAINLSGNSGNTTGDSTGSTIETGEPAHASRGPYNSVWWKFTPSSNGKLDLNTHGSSFDTVLAIYRGTAVNNLTEVDSNDDDGSANGNSGFTDVSLINGTTYYIAVGGYSSTESGSISLNWSFSTEDLQVATPTISPNGGSFDGSVDVTLACSTSGAQIRYTIDGTTPTSSSRTENPFTLTETTKVTVKAFKSGYTESELATATFTKIIPSKPDIQIPYYRIKQSKVMVGFPFFIEANVKNGGNANAGSSYIKLYLSTNTTLETDNNDKLINEISVGSLNSEEDKWVKFEFNMPDIIETENNIKIYFIADSKNQITEENENNIYFAENAFTGIAFKKDGSSDPKNKKIVLDALIDNLYDKIRSGWQVGIYSEQNNENIDGPHTLIYKNQKKWKYPETGKDDSTGHKVKVTYKNNKNKLIYKYKFVTDIHSPRIYLIPPGTSFENEDKTANIIMFNPKYEYNKRGGIKNKYYYRAEGIETNINLRSKTRKLKQLIK